MARPLPAAASSGPAPPSPFPPLTETPAQAGGRRRRGEAGRRAAQGASPGRRRRLTHRTPRRPPRVGPAAALRLAARKGRLRRRSPFAVTSSRWRGTASRPPPAPWRAAARRVPLSSRPDPAAAAASTPQQRPVPPPPPHPPAGSGRSLLSLAAPARPRPRSRSRRRRERARPRRHRDNPRYRPPATARPPPLPASRSRRPRPRRTSPRSPRWPRPFARAAWHAGKCSPGGSRGAGGRAPARRGAAGPGLLRFPPSPPSPPRPAGAPRLPRGGPRRPRRPGEEPPGAGGGTAPSGLLGGWAGGSRAEPVALGPGTASWPRPLEPRKGPEQEVRAWSALWKSRTAAAVAAAGSALTGR